MLNSVSVLKYWGLILLNYVVLPSATSDLILFATVLLLYQIIKLFYILIAKLLFGLFINAATAIVRISGWLDYGSICFKVRIGSLVIFSELRDCKLRNLWFVLEDLAVRYIFKSRSPFKPICLLSLAYAINSYRWNIVILIIYSLRINLIFIDWWFIRLSC